MTFFFCFVFFVYFFVCFIFFVKYHLYLKAAGHLRAGGGGGDRVGGYPLYSTPSFALRLSNSAKKGCFE